MHAFNVLKKDITHILHPPMGILVICCDIRCTYVYNKNLTCQFPLQLNNFKCLFVQVDVICSVNKFSVMFRQFPMLNK